MEGDKSINERKTKEFDGRENTCMGDRSSQWQYPFLPFPQTESYAAGGKVNNQVAVSNLPAKQLTLKKGKTFTLKPKVTVTGKISKEGYL